ncbi:MAG: hypothetical protein JWQ63_35 [Mucilaginibacter sp.]|nr:hypothetical protein [Mucilaginibacter sp.]
MKRTALLLLTAIYLVSCVGIGISHFYCCGKLASVTLAYGKENNTNKQTGKNCCKHEQQNFKVKDNHFNITFFSLNNPVPALIPSFTHLDNENIVNLLHTKVAYIGNAPPGHSDIPVYTLNCTYRI